MTTELLTEHYLSITELKKNPMSVVEVGVPVAILNRGKPVFYCITPELYARMVDILEDVELAEIANQREGQETVRVDIKTL